CRNPRAQPGDPAGHWIGRGLVQNREFRLRERSELVRLCEAFVETAQAGRASLNERAVASLAAPLVDGEDFVYDLPNQPAGLRRVGDVGVASLRARVGALYERRCEIADRDQAETGDRRIFRFERDLVGETSAQYVLDEERLRVGNRLAVFDTRKLPVLAGNQT